MENGDLMSENGNFRKRSPKWRLFENGGLSYECGRAKTKVFKHSDVANMNINAPVSHGNIHPYIQYGDPAGNLSSQSYMNLLDHLPGIAYSINKLIKH